MRRLLAVACGALVLASCQPPADPPTTGRVVPPAPPESSKLPPGPRPKDAPYVERPVTTADDLRGQWNGNEIDVSRLIREGERLFPLYQEVLLADNLLPAHAAAAFAALRGVAADRDRLPAVAKEFIGTTLKLLGHKQSSVRWSAVEFLNVIGSEQDTAPVAVILLDERTEVRFAAAKTLAKIGGPRDVLVLDIVITNADRYHDAKGNRLLPAEYDVKHFEKCKAELEARLQKQEKAEPMK